MALGEGDRSGTVSGSPYAFRTTLEDRSPLNDNMALLGEGRLDSRGSVNCRRQREPERCPRGYQALSLACSSLTLLLVGALAVHSSWLLYSFKKSLPQSASGEGSQRVPLSDLQALLLRDPLPDQVDLSREACGGTGVWYRQDASCQCFQCYAGPNCQTAIPVENCTFNAESGTPLLFEGYWQTHPAVEMRIPASEHIGYLETAVHPRLEAAIRAVHAMVGNIETEGRQIIVGLGSSQVILAALYALSSPDEGTAMVYAARPYYSAYPIQADFMQSRRYRWWNGTEPPGPQDGPVVEVVTSPNNPDGYIRQPTLSGARVLYDHAYLWPHFTPILEKKSYGPSEVATFTLSKLTGHAGSRLGWAVVADPGVAERMLQYLGSTTNFAFESQYRGTLVLEHLLASGGGPIEYAKKHMTSRWLRLRQVFDGSPRFAVLDPEEAGRYVTGDDNNTTSPPYLWLQCLQQERDPDCLQTLREGGIIGRPGPSFGMASSFARLELLMRPEEFDILLQKLDTLAHA